LAFAYAEKGENLDEAERLATQALRFFSSFSPIAKGAVLDTLGWIYYKQGRLELAEKTLKEAYELYSSQEVKAHLDEVSAAIGGK
jgi:tetratricopeptide (TPR) repeat protein